MMGVMQGAPAMPPPQPPTPEQMSMMSKPSWEQVMELLRDNAHRNFRIDIETDSTIASSLESDMTGLKEVLTGVSQFMQAAEPLMISGVLPMEAAKEIVMTITRRARMGMAVEDALDKMQAPQPQADPEAGKAQAEQQKMQMQASLDQQAAQQKSQHDQQMLAMEQQAAQYQANLEQQNIKYQANLDAQVEQSKQQAQAAQNAHQNALESQREQQRMQNEQMLEQMRADREADKEERDRQFELLITQMNNANKIEVAEVSKDTQLELAQMQAANEASQNALDRAMPSAAMPSNTTGDDSAIL